MSPGSSEANGPNPETATQTVTTPIIDDPAVTTPTDSMVESAPDCTGNIHTTVTTGGPASWPPAAPESTCNMPETAFAEGMPAAATYPAPSGPSVHRMIKWRPADILKWATKQPPELDYLFNDVFPTEIVGLLCGAGGLGKSTLILQIAMSLASGKTIFPRFCPPKPRSVMIFAGEDPERITWKRVHLCCKKFDFTADEMKLLHENLKVYCVPAKPLCMCKDGEVLTTDAYNMMQLEVTKHKPELLIVDPKSRWSGLNENSNNEATEFVMKLEELVGPYKGSVLMTHHVSKSGKDSLKSSASRGASAFVDAARLVFNMVGDENGKPGTILLNVSKSNMTAGFDRSVRFRHLPEYGGILEQLRDPNDQKTLFGMAEFLRDWLEANGAMNSSDLLKPKTDLAKTLHVALDEKFGMSKKCLDEAIELGVAENLLEVKSVGTKGRPAQKIFPVVPAGELEDDDQDMTGGEPGGLAAAAEPPTVSTGNDDGQTDENNPTHNRAELSAAPGGDSGQTGIIIDNTAQADAIEECNQTGA